MIPFFRKIRHRLLTENKFSKYFLYAIGEIALVMIGILLALQVNNWNAQRKLLVQEIEILHDFQERLNTDKKTFELARTQNSRVKKSAKFLLDYMKTGFPYKDTLKYHFGNTTTIWPTYLNQSVFESLKSKDLNLISNKELRNKIILLYGDESTVVGNNEYRNFIEFAGLNILNTRFESYRDSNYEEWITKNNYYTGYDPSTVHSESIPLDYNKLKTDQEYIYFLRGLISRYNWYIEGTGFYMQTALDDILQSIEAELKILEKK